jgi:hypothetical protein
MDFDDPKTPKYTYLIINKLSVLLLSMVLKTPVTTKQVFP